MEARGARLLGAAVALLVSGAVQAHGDDHDRAGTRLSGFEEVPALSTAARASFAARVERGEITYELSYRGIETEVTQAHIHFGQKSVNGGIVVFLCSNLGNGPVGTQACPAKVGTIRGTIVAANVIGPAGQGITAGQFDEFMSAMRSGITYANVHTVAYPGGEVRGQIRVDD